MAKTVVVKEPSGDRIPFLRGILVQSLVRVGIPFEPAFEIARQVKEELKEAEEISSHELHDMILARVEHQLGPQAAEVYDSQPGGEPQILVRTPLRNAPFSVGILAHSLESCAIEPQMAFEGARKVQEYLNECGHSQIHHQLLRRITYQCLRDHCSQPAAERYLSWRRFRNSGQPLIILLGGVPGTGKSTVAAELAYRLDVVRSQSTDLVRAIIRSYLPPHVAPTLAHSSFEAWRGLPAPRAPFQQKVENPVLAGFLTQFEVMKPALEATIARVVEERADLILEGVHVIPTGLELGDLEDKAIVMPLKIATLRKKDLRRKLERRGEEVPERASDRYLENMEHIWEMQSYLLDEADRADIPIIVNRRVEYSVRDILELVSDKVEERFPANHPPADGD